MKIFYFTNVPAPYRVKFFNILAQHNDLTVCFDYKKELGRNAKWYDGNKFNFSTIYCRKFALKQFIDIFSKEKYDIVIIGTYASINGALLNRVLKLKKIKFFINADGGFIDKNDNFITKGLKTFFISSADYYLSTGNATNKYLTYYGANKESIYLYPFSSIDSKDILSEPISYNEKKKLRKSMGYNYDIVFISVGSFIYRKGYDIFLDSLEYVKTKKNVCYIIIGGGEELNNYKDYLIREKINNVFFIDFLSHNEVLEYYKMSDVFFFPSREDIWGLVINEAMSCGLPIISSNNVLAAQELLDKDDLYDFTKPNKLADKINYYCSINIKELYKIGEINIKIIKNYTIENMAQRHMEVFNEVIRKK